MSFEAVVELAGGHDTTMAKAFVLAIKGIALSWYKEEFIPRSSFLTLPRQLCYTCHSGGFARDKARGRELERVYMPLCASEMPSKGFER